MYYIILDLDFMITKFAPQSQKVNLSPKFHKAEMTW